MTIPECTCVVNVINLIGDVPTDPVQCNLCRSAPALFEALERGTIASNDFALEDWRHEAKALLIKIRN